MGRQASAATIEKSTSAHVPKGNAFRRSMPFLCIGSMLVAGPSLGQAQQSLPLGSAEFSSPRLMSTEADPRSIVEAYLAQADTMAAIEVLQEISGDTWSDSLLDALVFPDDIPATPQRHAGHLAQLGTRIDIGRIPFDDDGIWTTSAQASWSRNLRVSGFDNLLIVALRAHGITSDEQTYLGLEPRLGWSFLGSRLGASAEAWFLLGSEIEPDAGFGSDIRFQMHPAMWLGAGFDLSLESNQEASLAVGTDRRSDNWVLGASSRLGWIRMIAPEPTGFRATKVDSLVILNRIDEDLPLDGAWDRGTFLSSYDFPQSIRNSSYDFEKIDPDRLRLRSNLVALRRIRGFRIGPSLDLDLRASTRRERWMPHARSTWAKGSSFAQIRGTSKVYAVAGDGSFLTGREARSLIDSYFACMRITPALRGTWASRSNLWRAEVVTAWNSVVATDPGHPLEDPVKGLELRSSVQHQW